MKKIKSIFYSFIALCLVLAMVSCYNAQNSWKEAAQNQIGTFENAIVQYQVDCKKAPPSLQALIENPNIKEWNGPYLSELSIPLDPWGNHYRYQINDEIPFVDSAGPDGIFDNADDIYQGSPPPVYDFNKCKFDFSGHWDIFWLTLVFLAICLLVAVIFSILSRRRHWFFWQNTPVLKINESFETQVMEYCLKIIRERREVDNEKAWLWDIKEKVGIFALKKYREKSAEGIEENITLSEQAMVDIEKNHPLLQCSVPQSSGPIPNEWAREIRRKFEKYAANLKKQYTEKEEKKNER